MTQEEILAKILEQIEAANTRASSNFNASPGPLASMGNTVSPRTGRTFQQEMAEYSGYATDSFARAKGGFDVYLAGVNDTFMGFAKNYEKINRAIGGYIDHEDLLTSSETTMVQAVNRLDDYIDMYGETTDSFIEMQREKGKALTTEEEARFKKVGVDFVTEYFKSGEEAAKIQSEILNKLITQNADAVNEIDRVSRAELALIQKNTGISAARIAQILENQIVATGEATNDALFKVTGYSDKLAKETGLSFKLIQDSTTRVMENMQQFGHVTVEEAQRISVQIQQLGMKYETFESLTQKFQDFSTSVSASGDISQLTGGAVQLDAQELAYLASEDQDAFLRELRRSFLDQGFDKDQFLAMTNAEQRKIAESMGMQRNEFAMLIDSEREISSKEQLDMLMQEAVAEGKTTEEQAMQRIKEERKPLEEAVTSTDEMMERARRAAMKHAKEYASGAMKDYIGFQTGIIKEFRVASGLTDKFSKSLMGGMRDSIALGKDGIKSVVNDVNTEIIAAAAGPQSGTTKAGKAIGLSVGQGVIFGLDQAGIYPRSLPPEFQKIVDSIEKHMPGQIKEVFAKTGESAGLGIKEGLAKSGFNPEIVMSGLDVLSKVKTKPMLIQKNIERITNLLEEVKKEDLTRYKTLIDELSKNIKVLNEKNSELFDNQKELIKALMNDTSVIIKMDGVEVGKGILNKVSEIENAGGLRFKTESE
jgi:hypothetical protein